MIEEKQTVKLTIEDSFGNKASVERSEPDIFASDMVNMFYCAMLGLTYQESTVLDALIDFAASKRDTRYPHANNTDDSFPLGIKYSSSVTDDVSCPHPTYKTTE